MDPDATTSPALPRLLQESAEDLYEHAPCGYVSTDPEGLILRINGTLLRWLGCEREGLVGRRRMQEFYSRGGRIFHETHVAPLLRMQGAVRSVALDLQRADGSLLPVLMSSEVRTDPATDRSVVRSTFFDAAERRAYETELLEARRKAEAADRAKAEFISMISHEIRTPLNAVMGIAYLLARTPLDEKQQKHVKTLRSSAESLLNLVNEVLDFSKLSSGRLTVEQRPLDLRKLAGDLVATQQVKADEKHISLELEVDPAVPDQVLADPVKLNQVLTNLVGNAIKFTLAGGVVLRLKVLSSGEEGCRIRFSVTDSGIGIEAAQLERIFDAFTQASYDIGMKYGGTGLGLSISRKLVELLGGELRVESEPGRGSTFSFELTCRTARAAVLPVETSERAALRGLRMLVVDDNEVNLFVLTGLLRDWGVEADVAHDGRQALDKLGREAFAAVLMDIRMPELDGFATSQAIRRMPGPVARVPIVAVSASMRMGQAEEIERAGFDGFVGKPINPDLLYATLTRLVPRP
jgi:PAS domain S-box-containing protein